jgi:cellobiose-specific phosphotransferase system component IIB
MSGKNTAPKGAEKDQENSVDKIDVTGLAPEVQAYISSLESKVEEHAACVEEI